MNKIKNACINKMSNFSKPAGQEYCVCFNSMNRDQIAFPEANNFVLQLASAGQTSVIPTVSQLYMGSIEMPCAQWTIEPSWGTLQFDQGLPTDVSNPGQLANASFQFTVSPGATPGINIPITIQIPPSLNPIIAEVPNGVAESTFTTQFPHGLAVISSGSNAWPAITIEGTTLTDPAVRTLNTNPTLVIIDDVTFRISNIPASTPAPIGLGYLRSLAPSPAQLAQGLSSAMAVTLPQVMQPAGVGVVSYNASTNMFTFEYNDGSPATLVMLTSPNPSLQTRMGFGANAMLQLTGNGSTLSTTGNYALGGCLSQLTFRPGNYTPETFAAEFERAWNPFVFNGGLAADPALRAVFAFTNAMGASFSFPIDYGTYSPAMFAAYLTAQMNAADPSQAYMVMYLAANQTMQFTSSLPFGLPFDDPMVTPGLVSRLGFEPLAYNGSMSYTGMSLAYAPSTCTNTPQLRSGNLRVVLRPNQNMFCLQFQGAPIQTAVLGAGGTLGPLPQAHGLQVGDFVTLTDAVTGDSYTVPVIAVPDAFTLQVDLYASGLTVGDTVAISSTDPTSASINLYFNNNPTLAQIMGFPGTAVFSDSDGSLCSAGAWNFHGPPYLLWVISPPNGSTYIQHYWQPKDDNKVNIFAKLILRHNTYSIERLFPMMMVLPGNQKIGSMRMAIYNPDHTLYHFHGSQWSGTIVMVTPTTSGALLCY